MSKYVITERSELFEPNVYIETLVDIEGPVNEDKLAKAVKSAFRANESLMSRICINENGEAEYKRITESMCSIHVENRYWQDIIRENEKKPFAIDKGELMRVFIIKKSNKFSLLVMAHHLAGDGKSMTYFINDVMQSLNGERLVFKPMNIISNYNFPKEVKIPLPIKLLIKGVNKKWHRYGRPLIN